jgi:hypothetical protein
LLDHTLTEIGSEDGAGCWQFVAVDFDDAGSDWAGAAAIVEDCRGFCEGEAFVCALDEGLHGGCAGAGAEFFVFFGEVRPVVAFGCCGGNELAAAWLDDTTASFISVYLYECRLGLLSESLKPSDILLMSASLRTAELRYVVMLVISESTRSNLVAMVKDYV